MTSSQDTGLSGSTILPEQATSDAIELSGFELTLTMVVNAYHRWIARGMATAGQAGMSPLEAVILTHVAERMRPRTFSDICLVLGIEDTYLAHYAIRKLTSAGLVETGRAGKEKTVTSTNKGAEVCSRFFGIRDELLSKAAVQAAGGTDLSEIAAALRALAGAYDQANRSAASW